MHAIARIEIPFVFAAVRVAESMQQEVTAKRGELDALQNKLVFSLAVRVYFAELWTFFIMPRL